MERERCSYRNPTLVVSVGSLPVLTKHRRWRDSRRSSLVLITLLSHKFISSNELKTIWISTWAFLHIPFFKGFWEKKWIYDVLCFIMAFQTQFDFIVLALPHSFPPPSCLSCTLPFWQSSMQFMCCLCSVCPHFFKPSFPICSLLSSFLVYTYSYPTYIHAYKHHHLVFQCEKEYSALAFLSPDYCT